jgi:hypothetical protein
VRGITPASDPAAPRRRSVLLRVLLVSGVAGAGLWSGAALFYASRGPAWLPPALAGAAALAFAACAVAAARGGRGGRAALALFAAVLGWFVSLPPSNTRDWEPEYRLAATAELDGDSVTLRGIRDGTYGADGTFRAAYRDETYDLAALDGIDLVASYWAGDSIAHVFLSFGFRDGRHLAISVETRRERDEPYSAIAGFFRRYELIYVVADERDLIGVRSDVRRERVYLYPVRATAAERRALFLSYVARIQALRDAPEFYDTLTNNCTTNVLARANAASGLIPNDWKVLVSGYADRYAYELGRLDTGLAFAELKRRSLVRRPAGATIGPGFSAEIRAGLPPRGGGAATRQTGGGGGALRWNG